MITVRTINIKRINSKLIALVVILAGLFFISQIIATSKIGTKSAEVEIIREEKDKLRLENEILKSKIDETKSITKISENAKAFNLQAKGVEQIDAAGQSNVALGN